MNLVTSEETVEKVRKGRGPGKKVPLACTSIRLTKEVMDYFDSFPDKQSRMRDVLTAYVRYQKINNGDLESFFDQI